MTEFLKNNPIALRHCLLYEFLHGKSIGTAFSDFCETVGKDVIEKKDIEFWFDEFAQGKFGDDKEPVDDMRDVLRNDKQALRACVMYEWLSTENEQNKALSVFEKYKKFCKVIGKNVMEYREFEYWFFNLSTGSINLSTGSIFVNREYSLDFERSKDKKIQELSDMPIDVMKHISQYLDIFDRSNLAQTSRPLKEFMEDQKLSYRSIRLFINYHTAKIGFGSGSRCISYKEKGDSCYKKFERKRKLIRGVSHWKKALQDFASILQYPKLYMNTLEIHFDMDDSVSYRIKPNHDGSDQIDIPINALEAALKSTGQLNIKKLTLKFNSLKPLLKILSLLKPEYLTTIHIYPHEPSDNVIKEVIEMEQWQLVKNFSMKYPEFLAPRHHLYHFKKFDVCYGDFSAQDIREMKEILFKSTDFEKCSIQLERSFDMDAFGREFGDAIPGTTHTYHYFIPNSTEYFEIEVSLRKIEITRKKI